MAVNRIALIGLSVLVLSAAITIALAQNTSNPMLSGNTTNPILSGNTVTQPPPVPATSEWRPRYTATAKRLRLIAVVLKPARLILEIDIGELLPRCFVFDDKGDTNIAHEPSANADHIERRSHRDEL